MWSQGCNTEDSFCRGLISAGGRSGLIVAESSCLCVGTAKGTLTRRVTEHCVSPRQPGSAVWGTLPTHQRVRFGKMKTKTFDAVKMMRELRDKLGEEMARMTVDHC